MFSEKTSVPVSVYLLGPMVISSSSYYNLVIVFLLTYKNFKISQYLIKYIVSKN